MGFRASGLQGFRASGLQGDGRDIVLDSLRGFAIILVVIGHLPGQLETLGVTSELGRLISRFVYSFHMALFFMISGYADGIKSQEKNLSSRLKKNFVSLYLPCMFFSFLQAFLNLAVFSHSNAINAHIPTLRHFLMIPLIGFLQYWFLCTLFFVKSLNAIFERVIKNGYLHSALWVIFFVMAGIFEGKFLDDAGIFGTDISRLWLEIFSRGMYFRLGYVISASCRKNPGIFWGMSLLAAGILFFEFVNGFVSKAGSGVCISLGLLILFYAFNMSNKFLSACGIYSMVIYCTHNYAAAVFRILCKITGLALIFPAVLLYAVCFSCAMFIPLMIVWLYKNVKCLRWIEYVFYPGKKHKIPPAQS